MTGTGRNDDIITAANVDLSSCDRELVQFAEAIQPHGVMLTVDEHSNLILHASANCARLVGAGPEAVVGRNAGSVLAPAWRDAIAALRGMSLDSGPVNLARESFVGSDRGFNLFAHRSGGLIILEFEDAPGPPGGPSSTLYATLRADIARLQETRGLQSFFDLAVERIRSFSGFDRVMAYRFDEDGSGHVVAEARRDDLEGYLGLHYPASDIPAPARRLFAMSWVRHLPDVDYVPVPLVAAPSAVAAGPVDMSYAALRSVSVMYTGYLRNMGVRSTLVMPLMKEGRLWGLISAMHHAAPRHIPHETRMAVEFLAHTLSLLMSSKEDAEIFGRVLAMQATTDRIVDRLSGAVEFGRALREPDMLSLLLGQVEACGAAVASAANVALVGSTPTQSEVRELLGWIGEGGDLVATDRLSSLHEPARAYARGASGILAVRLPSTPPEYLVWFRPEQIQDVQWAGDPRKPVEVGAADGALRLRPRSSFALWRESVLGRSVAWREDEKDAVRKLATTVARLVVERADKIERIHRELEASRADRDTYAHAASSDLREHVRGIHHLTTSLRRRHGDSLDEEGQRQIATILKLTQRMDGLINAILEHSRAGEGAMMREAVDLDAVVDAALATVARLGGADVEIRRPSPLGQANCNREWIGEVFASLIGNAAKYNDKPVRWIEIGAEPTRPTRYYVRDNGIGIAAADQELVFRMFRRLHEPEDYGGGSGIGLALTRKIVERHGGRIWVESTPGEGSTFSFTLAPDAAH